jgi:Pyruvate/2-oxoacid:ferredoxin oxidoreductase delta subunit
MPFRPILRYNQENRPQLLAACEPAVPRGGDGVLPCVYSLGTGDMLAAWQKGVRALTLATGECETCPRNRRAEWTQNLQALNQALGMRQAEPLVLRHEAPDAWAALLAMPAQPATSRRGFLRGALSGLTDAALKDETPSTESVPAGTLLPPGIGITPWAIQIDREACTACLLCTRLCAHGALVFSEEEEGAHLQAHSLRCTGCRLCLDACEPKALSLAAWQEARPQSLRLESRQCPRCRAAFHVLPGNQIATVCPTCARLNRPDPRKPLIG